MLSSLFPIIFKSVSGFFGDFVGLLNSPYQTVRRISVTKPMFPVLIFLILIWIYFSFAVLVKFGFSAGPIFLTFNLGKLLYATVVLYLLVAVSMYAVGRLFGGMD